MRAVRSTSSREPSTETSRSAPASGSMPKANSDSTARMEFRSKTSMATGVTRARVKAGGQAQGAGIVLKGARTVRVALGSGRRLQVRLGDDPEHPSRAADESRQIEPDDVLADAASRPNYLARR